MRIALNGFGRIGKTFLRIWLQNKNIQQQCTLVTINVGPSDPTAIAYMARYDTIMGTYPGSVTYYDNTLHVDNHKIAVLAEPDATKLPWKSYDIDWVVDVSGHFTKKELAKKHLQAGAKKVLISAPMQEDDITIIPGINDTLYDSQQHTIVSLGSCTTNAVVTALYALNEIANIEQAFVGTTHAYTNSQTLLDVNAQTKDPRKSRAAALNIIPTTTGANKLIGRILPQLEGKVIANALRVPVSNVSLFDITYAGKNKCTPEMIHAKITQLAQDRLKGIIDLSTEPLVSSDYVGNAHSATIDSLLTYTQGSMGKVYGWYDNEWGYSQRLLDFLCFIAR